MVRLAAEVHVRCATHLSKNGRTLIGIGLLLLEAVTQVLHTTDTGKNIVGSLMDTTPNSLRLPLMRHSGRRWHHESILGSAVCLLSIVLGLRRLRWLISLLGE